MDKETDIALLDVTEVAQFLKISVSTVRRLQQHRQLPFCKVGGLIRFTKSDIVDYVKSKRVAALF
jgi:excisionase family DNA binding protein